MLLATTVGAAGQTVPHWWAALVLLGVGWNFLFVGGSAMLATTHQPAERGKVQGFNEMVILGLVAVVSLMAGVLEHTVGWTAINLGLMPIVGVTAIVVWRLTPRLDAGSPAPADVTVAPDSASASTEN